MIRNLQDLAYSATAAKKGIDNTIPTALHHNAERLASAIDQVELLIGQPVTVTSAFRNPEVNALVGGKENSYHKRALAADLVPPPGMSCNELQHAVASDPTIPFDLILEEGTSDGKHTWVHCQLAEDGVTPRHLMLDAEVAALGGKIIRYVPG